MATWPEVVASWPPQRLITELEASGLRGRGGAGYPVAAKWSAAAAGQAPRYVVANGDEGDPGSFCDRVLMEQDPHRVLAGLAYGGHAVGAERGGARDDPHVTTPAKTMIMKPPTLRLTHSTSPPR
jgi:NADH:ubiquinone oxidoreductase subunit F (NADH-binding)